MGSHIRLTRLWPLVLGLALALLTAYGCGASSSSESEDTGSIAFSLRMAQASGDVSAAVQGATIDCATSGITSVEAYVYDEHDTLLVRGGPWPCNQHTGVINNVRQGKNRTVVIKLRNDSLSESEAVRYSGERTPVTIIAGKTTNIGFVDLIPEEVPEALGDSARVNCGGTLYVLDSNRASVMWNDAGTGLTVNTNPVAAPQHGTLTLHSDGTFRYVNTCTGDASDSFTYEARDLFGRSTTATVVITIIPNIPPINHPPELSQAGVSPDTGTPATTPFTYNVHYYDADGDEPVTASVYIDNDTTPRSMTLVSGTAGTYTFTRTIPFVTGVHSYYCIFADGKGGSARLPQEGSLYAPVITDPLHPLLLADDSFSPAKGTTATLFTYRVHFQGVAGHTPRTHSIIIDNQASAMTLESGNAWDGIYVFQTRLSSGIHTYAFSFADDVGAVKLPLEGVSTGPAVAVSLEGIFVAPAPIGDDAQEGTVLAPFATIGHAIAVAQGTEEKPISIYFAAGTYHENLTPQAWESLQGGWRNDFTERWRFVAGGISPTAEYETIIDGGGSARCLNINGQDGITIDGFTIQHGKSQGPGGGLYIVGCSPVMKHCRVVDNLTASYGGGIACKEANPAISACLISANRATGSEKCYGGGLYNENANPVITNCIFAENYAGCSVAAGGGMYNNASNPVITNSIFRANQTGGDNSFGAGIYNASSHPVITNTVFASNQAAGSTLSKGGGIFNASSSPVIINCTFTRNGAALSSTSFSTAGAIYNDAASAPTITNTILWGDCARTGSELFIESGSGATITYCNIDQAPEENDATNHIIRLNPCLAGAATGDWHLLDGSPCINAGTNAAPGLPKTDFEGDARILHNTVDIGVDEHL